LNLLLSDVRLMLILFRKKYCQLRRSVKNFRLFRKKYFRNIIFIFINTACAPLILQNSVNFLPIKFAKNFHGIEP